MRIGTRHGHRTLHELTESEEDRSPDHVDVAVEDDFGAVEGTDLCLRVVEFGQESIPGKEISRSMPVVDEGLQIRACESQ